MDKLAQKRRLNLLNKVREDTNLTGKWLENKNEDFQAFMEKLREVDEKVRELIISENGDNSLKDRIKVARSNFNRREYINTVIILGQFHEILAQIADEFKSLEVDQKKIHNKFLFDGLDESQKSFLMNKMPETFKKKEKKKKASIVTDEFIKEAGVSDMWSNMFSERGQALKAWEKKFPKFAKVFKRETEKMLNRSDSLYQTLTGTLKAIGILRAHRKVEEYLAVSGVFVKKFDAFHNEFGDYYDQYVNELVQTQRSIDAELPKANPAELPANPVAMDDPGLKGFVAVPGAPPIVTPGNVAPAAPVVPDASSVVVPAASPASPVAPSGGAGTARNFAPPAAQVVPPPPVDNRTQKEREGMAKMEAQYEANEAARVEKSKISRLNGIDAAEDNTPPKTLKSHELAPPVTLKSVTANSEMDSYVPDTVREEVEELEEEDSPDTVRDDSAFEPDFIPKPAKLPFEFEEIVNQDQRDYERVMQAIQRKEDESASQQTSTVIPKKHQKHHVATKQFLEELSASGENTLVIASKIVKFANSIAGTDKKNSEKLLSIAKNLLSKI